MVQFQISRGIESELPQIITDGKIYFCIDTGNLFIDYNTERIHVNANKAQVLTYLDDETNEYVDIDVQTLLENLGSGNVYAQNDEPTDAPEGSLWVDLDAEGSTSGGTSTITGIPHFNLTEMGLPSIESVGNLVSVKTDTSDIYVALGKSPVKVSIDFLGKVLTCIVNTTKFDSIDAYQAVVHGEFYDKNLTLIINVWETKMNAIVYEGSIAGGGGNCYVTFTDGTEDGDTLTYSHTALEVKNMIDSGYSVIGIYKLGAVLISLLNISAVLVYGDVCQITFTNCRVNDASETLSQYIILKDKSSVTNATLKTCTATGLPTGGTVGQLLTINSDGDYVWIDTADVLDKTLTQEGQAADAKAVGDKLGEKITTPSTATIGKTIAVKAIDENGKPTEWEAVDLPGEEIGDLNNLTTTDKTSLVAAINELAASAGAGSGESSVFRVTVDAATMTASHSQAEILDAVNSGKTVHLYFSSGDTITTLPLITVTENYAEFYATGYRGYNRGYRIQTYHVFVRSDKTVNLVNNGPIISACVPVPTEADYGKVLSFTADGLVWVEQSGGGSDVPSGEGVEF